MVQNGPIWSKIVQDNQKPYKKLNIMVQHFQNCSKMVQNGARLSKIVNIFQNGPKS